MSGKLPYGGEVTSSRDLAQRERQLLCDLFISLGPDAPTLCEGWDTRHLAAHLFLRESRPDAALGLVGGPMAKRLDQLMSQTAARPWPELVDAIRNGPPPWSPMRWLDGVANLVEFVVHREDVKRAQSPQLNEDRDGATLDMIWSRAKMSAPLLLRGQAVTLTWPDHESYRLRGDEALRVELIGSPVDLLLVATGRAVPIDIQGTTEAVAAFNKKTRRI